MTKIKPRLLMAFGLLALGLTLAACIPQATNINNANQEQDQAAMMPAEGGSQPEADQNMTFTNINTNQTNTNTNIAATKTFNLSARNFAFSQTEIRVKKGDKVKIVLTSSDGFHDWTVDEFEAQTDRINTGQSATAEFVADKTGTFEYYCSVGSHRQMGMVGKLIVE